MLARHHRIRLGNRLMAAWEQWRQKLVQHHPRNSLAKDLGRCWPVLWQVYDRLLTVEERGHTASAARLIEDFHAQCQYLTRILSAIPNVRADSGITIPSLRDFLAEFNQIDDEFEEFTVDWKLKKLRVVTEPVTLEDVELGRFAIDLHWLNVGENKASYTFDIVALDPHPSREKSNIVHPHVQDRVICIGDADRSLTKAMEQGRLCDAFVLIRSVLTTYNRDSAYATLKDWHGQPCSDCGATMREDESYGCERCGTEVCSQCSSMCEVCECSHCLGCLMTCDVCDKSHCRSCRVVFKDRTLCKDCIEYCTCCKIRTPKDEYDVDTELCKACQSDNDEEEANDEDVSTVPATAGETPAHV